MKVLMHSNSPSSSTWGVSKVMVELSNELSQKGIEVDLLYGTSEEKNTFTYLDDLRGPFKLLKHTKHASKLFEKKIKNKQYDIIHSHTPEAAFDSLNAKFPNNPKFLVHLHGLDKSIYDEWLKEVNAEKLSNDLLTNFYLKKSIKKADWVFKNCENFVAISKSVVKETSDAYSVKPDLLYNGFDFKPRPINSAKIKDLRQKLGFSDNDKMVLFVGNNPWRKGLPYLIEAMQLLPDEYRLVTLGLTQDQFSTLKNTSKTINVGRVPHEDTYDYYSAADVFCMPSLYEPFGLVYLEAQSMKTPIIGAIGTGAQELIQEKSNGYLCEKRNPKSIANAIEKAVKLKGKTPKIDQDFSWKNSVKNLVKIYDKIV